MSAIGRSTYCHHETMNPHWQSGKVHSLEGKSVNVKWGPGCINCYYPKDLELVNQSAVKSLCREQQEAFFNYDFSNPELLKLGLLWGILEEKDGGVSAVEPMFTALIHRMRGHSVLVLSTSRQ